MTDMSEEKEIAKAVVREMQKYKNFPYDEALLRALEPHIKSLESRLKEAEALIERTQPFIDHELGMRKKFESLYKSRENQANMLEQSLKEAEKNNDERREYQGKIIENLEQRLSQAEAEKKELTEKYSCCGGSTSCANNQTKFFCDEMEERFKKDPKEAKECLYMVIESLETDRDWNKAKAMEFKAKLSSPATLGDILEIIEDYCEGPYPVSKDGKNANGKTYLDFATALLKKVGV